MIFRVWFVIRIEKNYTDIECGDDVKGIMCNYFIFPKPLFCTHQSSVCLPILSTYIALQSVLRLRGSEDYRCRWWVKSATNWFELLKSTEMEY